MRIALPVDRRSRDANIFEHFGRAPYYMLVDVKDGNTLDISFIENLMIRHEAGDIPRMLKAHGVDVVICMGIGRRARTFFEEYGISIVAGAQGNALEAVKAFLEGKLVDKEYIPKRKWHQLYGD